MWKPGMFVTLQPRAQGGEDVFVKMRKLIQETMAEVDKLHDW